MRKQPETPVDPKSLGQVRLVSVSALRTASWNPRRLTATRLDNLKRSIQTDPEFLWDQPILAMADGTVYSGNQRLRAAMALGHETIPAIVADVPLEIAKRRALVANNQWAEWDDDALSEFIYGLREDGVDLTLLGFEDKELVRILDASGALGEGQMPPETTVTCPQCGATFNS